MKYLILIILPFLLCCHEGHNNKVRAEKGRIDIINNIYFHASQGLEDVHSFHVSKLNYHHDLILEIIPDMNFPEMDETAYCVIDSVYYNLENPENLGQCNIFSFARQNKAFPLYQKQKGALFGVDSIPYYEQRKELRDTILFNKKYKRFEIETPLSFSRYYVYPTDTILPYSINRKVEIDYNGRIERIDTYNKKEDLFITLQLIPNSAWSPQARAFFEYTDFLKNSQP